MSLFDKLTGLAQKAKDSVVSKTLISKDRRLERSLSERIKVSDIYFEKISTYGLPSKLDVVAFDCIASLLAVGNSKHGYVKVFGKGISATIKLPKSSGIKYLQFKNGYPILVVIDTKNIIITIDLRTKSIRHTLQAQQIITCHEYCTGTDWLFIGYANGYVDVFDIMQGCLSPYQIPNLIETLSDQQKGKPAANNENYNCEQRNVVVDLQIHPIDLNTLMIGYNSALFIWNIREATIRKSFTLQKLKMPVDYNINAGLTCFAWNPDGTHFVTGNDDGYVHLWDIKNEHKPVASKKVAEYFAASNKNVSNDDKHSFVGPIYQIAWYTNDKLQKSYMLIAADLEAQQIHGLTILEYDLLENSDNNNYKEVKKQTLLPLSRDLSHFLILGNDPYYLGLRNPLAVAVIDIDHSLQIYSLEHGYPRLKLPPALEFINPNVLNACYIPNISDSVFKQVTAYTMSDQKTRYLPITGGSVGPDHVYHVTSNDLLLTIHQGEIIKFWDASYTGLRPLSHLTIYSRDELTSEDAFICCVDFNKMTGTVSIGMSDGFVLIYQYHPDPEPPTNINPKFLNRRNEEFINSCDDTLEEISALLNEMQKDSSDVIERSMNNNEEQNPSDSTNPFLKTELQGAEQKDELDMKTPETTASYSSATRTSEESTTSSVSFNRIYSNPISSGYYPCLTIKLGSPVRGILSIDNSIITVTLDNGQLYLIDIMNLYSYEITRDIAERETVSCQRNVETSHNVDNNSAQDISPETMPCIVSMKLFNTYSPSKVMTVSPQLFVGMNNGNVHQIDLSEIENIRTANFEEHPIVHATEGSSLINLHVIDLLEGKLQTITDRKYSNTNARDSPLTVAKISTAGSSENSNEHSLITDNGNKSSSTSENTVISSSNCVHQQSRDGNSLHHGTSSSVSSSSTVISKRMIAIGKGEYQRQQNPHLLICTSTRSISVFMTGYNIKLVSKELNETSIVHSEVIITQHGSCLCVLLDNGRLAFLSLPHLEPMLERSLPNSCLLDRLNEAFLTQDGRIVFWTGDYELEQYSVIQKANFPIGESVILFNAQKSIPPQSCTSRMQQKPKKSWIDAVAGAFQKEPLTVEEFDLLMGRMPVEDPNEIRKQKVEAYKAKMKQQETAGDTGNNSSNVFAQLGQKMNERGEKLNELDKKFQDMNAASGDFLKAIRDYNERQARKKWWEF